MSYEVFIEVRHQPKHGEDAEQTEWDAAKMSDANADGYPEDFAPLIHVAGALRSFADNIDPRYICSNCKEPRGRHHREDSLYRCFNASGPITQALWWMAPDDRDADREAAEG